MFTRSVCYWLWTLYNAYIHDVKDAVTWIPYYRVYKNLHESVHDLHACHTLYTYLYLLYKMVHDWYTTCTTLSHTLKIKRAKPEVKFCQKLSKNCEYLVSFNGWLIKSIRIYKIKHGQIR